MTEKAQKRIKLCCYAAVEEKEVVDQLRHSMRETFSPLTVSWQTTLLSPAME